MTLSCSLWARPSVPHLEQRLGSARRDHEDGRFTLRRVECLAACGGGPCLQVGFAYTRTSTRRGRPSPGDAHVSRDPCLQGHRRAGTHLIDTYRKGALTRRSPRPRQGRSGGCIEVVKASGLRPRRPRLPTGLMWSLSPSVGQAEVRRVQRERERARDVQGSDSWRRSALLIEGILAGFAIQRTRATSTCAVSSRTSSASSTRLSARPRRGPARANVATSGFRFAPHAPRRRAYICARRRRCSRRSRAIAATAAQPPFPAVEGLYASPTVVNNVERS